MFWWVEKNSKNIYEKQYMESVEKYFSCKNGDLEVELSLTSLESVLKNFLTLKYSYYCYHYAVD